MLLQWLSKLEPVHRAATPEDREAVCRFRYKVYIEELKYNHPAADHERKRLWEPEDDAAESTILYTGTLADMTSTIRFTVWPPGKVPPEYFHKLSLELFPGIERLGVSYIGRLMIRRTLRGGIILPSLLRVGYEYMAGQAGADLGFVACVPGLVRHYRRLGAVPYAGRLVDMGFALGIPLLLPMSDAEHLRRLGSPVASLVKKYYGRGKRPAVDMAPYRHLISGEELPVEFDSEKVWQELQEQLVAEGGGASFLDGLPPKTAKRLASSGFLLTFGVGDMVTKEGIDEREAYVVLDGAFEILRGGRRVGLLEKGDLFGEVAFFTEAGKRTASVRALTPGRVLVLRRRFLEQLAAEDAEAAYQVLLNMSRAMAERLASIVRGGEEA